MDSRIESMHYIRYRVITANCNNGTLGSKANHAIIDQLKQDYNQPFMDFNPDCYVIHVQEADYIGIYQELTELLQQEGLSQHYHLAKIGSLDTLTKPISLIKKTGMASLVIYHKTLQLHQVHAEQARRSKHFSLGNPTAYNKGGLIGSCYFTRNKQPFHLQTLSAHLDSATTTADRSQDWLNVTQAVMGSPRINEDSLNNQWQALIQRIPHVLCSGYDANTRNKMIDDKAVNLWFENSDYFYEQQAFDQVPLATVRYSQQSTYHTTFPFIDKQPHKKKRPDYAAGGTLDILGVDDGQFDKNDIFHRAMPIQANVISIAEEEGPVKDGVRDHAVLISPLLTYESVNAFTRVRNHISSRLMRCAPHLASDIDLLQDSPESRQQLLAIHNVYLTNQGLLCQELALHQKKLATLETLSKKLHLSKAMMKTLSNALFSPEPWFNQVRLPANQQETLEDITRRRRFQSSFLQHLMQLKTLSELQQSIETFQQHTTPLSQWAYIAQRSTRDLLSHHERSSLINLFNDVLHQVEPLRFLAPDFYFSTEEAETLDFQSILMINLSRLKLASQEDDFFEKKHYLFNQAWTLMRANDVLAYDFMQQHPEFNDIFYQLLRWKAQLPPLNQESSFCDQYTFSNRHEAWVTHVQRFEASAQTVFLNDINADQSHDNLLNKYQLIMRMEPMGNFPLIKNRHDALEGTENSYTISEIVKDWMTRWDTKNDFFVKHDPWHEDNFAALRHWIAFRTPQEAQDTAQKDRAAQFIAVLKTPLDRNRVSHPHLIQFFCQQPQVFMNLMNSFCVGFDEEAKNNFLTHIALYLGKVGKPNSQMRQQALQLQIYCNQHQEPTVKQVLQDIKQLLQIPSVEQSVWLALVPRLLKYLETPAYAEEIEVALSHDLPRCFSEYARIPEKDYPEPQMKYQLLGKLLNHLDDSTDLMQLVDFNQELDASTLDALLSRVSDENREALLAFPCGERTVGAQIITVFSDEELKGLLKTLSLSTIKNLYAENPTRIHAILIDPTFFNGYIEIKNKMAEELLSKPVNDPRYLSCNLFSRQAATITLKQYIQTTMLNDNSNPQKLWKAYEIYATLAGDSVDWDELDEVLKLNTGWGIMKNLPSQRIVHQAAIQLAEETISSMFESDQERWKEHFREATSEEEAYQIAKTVLTGGTLWRLFSDQPKRFE